MILTLTPNPALDITYRLTTDAPGLRVGDINRIATVTERAGGKGVNVARVLAAYHVPVCAMGPIGGVTGELVRGLLDAAGVDHDLTPIAGTTRRTVTIVGADNGIAVGGGATGLWEPGPEVTAAEWHAVCAAYGANLARADVVVLSGSLPPGVPVDAYHNLVARALAAGVPVVLDADGAAMRHGLRAGPTVVKPNAAELAALLGQPVTDVATAITAGRGARTLGARDVIVSLGRDGMIAVVGNEVWSAQPPETFAGNATGAGDAAVAALAMGLAAGDTWPTRLTRMVAWSAAAAAAPVAGDLAPATADALAAGVLLRSAPLGSLQA